MKKNILYILLTFQAYSTPLDHLTIDPNDSIMIYTKTNAGKHTTKKDTKNEHVSLIFCMHYKKENPCSTKLFISIENQENNREGSEIPSYYFFTNCAFGDPNVMKFNQKFTFLPNKFGKDSEIFLTNSINEDFSIKTKTDKNLIARLLSKDSKYLDFHIFISPDLTKNPDYTLFDTLDQKRMVKSPLLIVAKPIGEDAIRVKKMLEEGYKNTQRIEKQRAEEQRQKDEEALKHEE